MFISHDTGNEVFKKREILFSEKRNLKPLIN